VTVRLARATAVSRPQRGSVSAYGALSLVSLYSFHDGVQTCLESARSTVDAEHAEAMAALCGAVIGMLGRVSRRAGWRSVWPARRSSRLCDGSRMSSLA